MLKSLFSRHGDSHTVMESPDVATTSRAPAVEYASFSRMAVPQAGHHGASGVLGGEGSALAEPSARSCQPPVAPL